MTDGAIQRYCDTLWPTQLERPIIINLLNRSCSDRRFFEGVGSLILAKKSSFIRNDTFEL